MKTPDEIKKGLTWCIKSTDCKGCPYEDDCYVNLRNTPMVKEALAYIQHLEANLSKVKAELKRLTQNHIEDMKIICKLERERDAAVADLSFGVIKCDVCKHGRFFSNDCIGLFGDGGCSFEWRGVCPENTEVQE